MSNFKSIDCGRAVKNGAFRDIDLRHSRDLVASSYCGIASGLNSRLLRLLKGGPFSKKKRDPVDFCREIVDLGIRDTDVEAAASFVSLVGKPIVHRGYTYVVRLDPGSRTYRVDKYRI